MSILLLRGWLFILLAGSLHGQGTLEDYRRAAGLAARTSGLVVNSPGPSTWIGNTNRFWYTRQVKGGNEFVLVDAVAGTKSPAFDHDRMAAALTRASGGKFTGLTLPTGPNTQFPDAATVQFASGPSLYRCTLADYVCAKTGPISAFPRRATPEAPEVGGDPADGLEFEGEFPQEGGVVGAAVRQRVGCGTAPATGDNPVCVSLDGKSEAYVENFNLYVRPVGSKEPGIALSTDGSEGNRYIPRTIAWSPDSSKLVAYKTRPGYDRQVHYIESSPTDQLQPKHSSIFYRKPGDALDIARPALFDLKTKTGIEIADDLFPNAYNLTAPVWWKDGRGFTFEYNERGHQVYRVIEVDAATCKARALIDERSKTFIYYNLLGPGLSGGRRYRYDVAGKETIWASERDGWEHLYLYDAITGKVKNQITKGPWVVRNVDFVDEAKRQIWFEAGGMNPGQDPYFTHYYRINFDGTGLTALTQVDGNHTVAYSQDRKFYVDTWSRVDLPPVSQLRRTDDPKFVLDLDHGDATALLATGIHYPEVFVAKGRDGVTDIWGVIVRPSNFDPAKKYPVIEQIYAGPQGSFVPKSFSPVTNMQSLAELGFIVVQIDGMGTSNRSKSFHDVAWKNLGDAGFPDRILWHKAVAAKYPYYDTSRVGIYGTSAGGQNALGGVLFHPEFYKVVVTNSGCHDNRMDKIWWNEQWMGWPVGPQYAASSNVDNAHRLEGRALIIIGEMDSNVDPASSLQVVNALVKAKKHFDMLFIPGQNHGVGVLASQFYLQDYFVHHLLGIEPPDWNHVQPALF